MTNREWLMEQMQNMSDEEFAKGIYDSDIITNVLGCDTTHEKCESFISCANCVSDWLKAEHKEKIKLSEAERVILENVDKLYKWIAKDKNGSVVVYSKKPVKDDKKYMEWLSVDKVKALPFSHLFQFIKWSDSEPYNIEELLNSK